MSPSFLDSFLLLAFELQWEYFQAFPQTKLFENQDSNLTSLIFQILSVNTKV